jgi:hypothetical protein
MFRMINKCLDILFDEVIVNSQNAYLRFINVIFIENKLFMFKNFTASDLLMLTAAFLSLIFSELLWFNGEKESAIFIGLWVPSILGFAILLKLIKNQK